MTDNHRQRGTIVRLIPTRGFGFIRVDATAEEYFFHASALDLGAFARLSVGDTVTFEIGESDKGPRAECVELV